MPLSLAGVVGETLGSIWSLELPFARTMVGLMRCPGRVADQWLRGRRRRFTHPVKFLVIFGVVVALTHAPLHAARADAFESGPLYDAGLAHHASDSFGLFGLALLVPIGAAVWAAARTLGVRRRWLEWYVLGLYTYAAAAGLQLGWLLLGLMGGWGQLWWWPVVEFALPLAWFSWGAWGFGESGARGPRLAGAILGHALVLLLTVALASLFTA